MLGTCPRHLAYELHFMIFAARAKLKVKAFDASGASFKLSPISYLSFPLRLLASEGEVGEASKISDDSHLNPPAAAYKTLDDGWPESETGDCPALSSHEIVKIELSKSHDFSVQSVVG